MDDTTINQIVQPIIRRTIEETVGMRKRDLVALHDRMMRERGSCYLLGGPRSAQDYYSAIIGMRVDDAVQVAHLAEAGPGHERCPSINNRPTCEWQKQRDAERNQQ